MTAVRRRLTAPRLAPALTLDLLPAPTPARLEPAAPVAAAEAATPKPAPALTLALRDFDAKLEVIHLDADTYVEREYRAGYHHYSLWEEGRDGVGYQREALRRSVRWGRVDTSYPYEAPGVPAELLGAAIDVDLRRLRELEDRIIAACPELEELDLPGPLYRSRGVVRLGGDPRVRFNAAMSRRPPT